MADAMERMVDILDTLVKLWLVSAEQAKQALKKPEEKEGES